MEAVVTVLLMTMIYMASISAVRGFYNHLQVQQALRTATSTLYWARFQALEKNKPIRLSRAEQNWEIAIRSGGKWMLIRVVKYTREVVTKFSAEPVFYPQGNVAPTSSIDLMVKNRHYQITLAITGRIKVKRIV